MKKRFSIILLMMALAFSAMPYSFLVQAQHLPEEAAATGERAPSATITADGTICTLIDAITAANSDSATNGCTAGSGADTITLQTDVTLTTVNNTTDGANGLPSITSEIIIEGAGHTIQRNATAPDFRILHVASNGNLTLNQTTVTGGSTTGTNSGGGIYNRGTISLNYSTISQNKSNFNSGGIHNTGTISLSHSTISGNFSNVTGGGIYNLFGSISVSNSTISQNKSNFDGGGLYNISKSITVISNSTISSNFSNKTGGGISNLFGNISVSNSTIIDNNSRSDGGGIHNGGSINIISTIILNNSAAGNGDEIYNGSTVTANNYNLLGDNRKSNNEAFYDFIAGATDLTATSDGTNPTALGSILETTLADYGGDTQTHALVPGSPAIDAVRSGEATDQRGVARPQGANKDIGAFEVKAQEIRLTGNSNFMPNGSSTPSSTNHTDFGELLINSDMTRTFTISNMGTGTLNVTSVSVSPTAAFSVMTQPANSSLASGASTTFAVQFAPSTTGVHQATVSIANDDADEDPYTFVIAGTGTNTSTGPGPGNPGEPPANQAPVLSTPLPDITVTEGAADQTLNLLDYFSDPESDLLYFTIMDNSNREVAPFPLVGQELENQMLIQFGTPGQTVITIEAKEDVHGKTYQGSFTITVLERPSPTLSIEKAASDSTVEAGQQITYTLAISNSGPGTATNALISDALPTGVTFVPGSISATGLSVGTLGSAPPTLASGVTLAANEMLELSFAVTVDADVLANQPITNTAQVTSTEATTPVQASQRITTMAPTLAISDVTVAEEDGSATFVVRLAKASAIPVTVEYHSAMGSAGAEDCVPTNGTLTIAAGATEGLITMQIIDDQLPEGDESFTMQLSNASNATISDGEAVGTITDNDQPPTSVSLASLSAQDHLAGAGYAGALLALLAVAGLLVARRRKEE